MILNYTVDDMDTLLRAIRYAERMHRGQTRKDAAASPYIGHPLAVMELLWAVGEVREVAALAAAVLHDTIEDTETTAEELEALFGSEIVSVVLELTDDKSLPKGERKRQQVEHAPHKSQTAAQIKIADKAANIRDVLSSPPADWPLERKQAYVQWGADVVAALPPCNDKLEAHFQQILAEARTTLQE